MKKAFTIIGLLICFNSYPQSVFKPAIAFGENFCDEFETVAKSKFINKFSSSALKFIRIQNTLTTGWTAAYCDCELCHGETTDSAKFTLAIGDSCVTSAHFYPHSIKGSGIMKVKIFPENNRSNMVIGEYRATCWAASATFIKNEKLEVSPNPANSVLNIKFGSAGAYTINMFSSDGKLIVSEIVNSLNNSMDISTLNNGLFTVKIESAGKIFYSKFIKM